MEHTEIIVDSGSRFIIEPQTRTIQREDKDPLVLVQGDHNSERVTFTIPRHVDGHDMSLCGRVEIHYINIGKTANEISEDVYIVNDLTDKNEEVVSFTWLIAKTATVYSGTLVFLIRFLCFDGDSKIVYALNTNKFKSIVVGEGCNCSEANVEEYNDLLESWHKATIEETKTLIAAKVNITDIVDSLETNASKKPLSAYQGRILDNKIKEIKKDLADKMDGYTALDKNADLDNLDDGWYHLPGGHDNFHELIGHNYPHTLYQTTSLTDYKVQILICPASIMWRGLEDGKYFYSWRKLSLDVVDNLTSTDTTSALSANQGKVLNDKIGDIDTALDNIIAIQNELMGVSE